MSQSSTAAAAAGSSGIGFGGFLALIFITLKLCGVINWPWIWVLSPLWIPVALFALIVAAWVGILAACGLIVFVAAWNRKRKRKVNEKVRAS